MVNTSQYDNQCCAATKVGIIMRECEAIGFFPATEGDVTMYQSIKQYWKGLKTISAIYRSYGHKIHSSSYNAEKCFGDFGITNNARDILQRYANKDV